MIILASDQLPKWWTELSPEGQKEYLKDHPDSKYADKLQRVSENKQHFTKGKMAGFLKSEEGKPESKERRSAAKIIKDKSKAFIQQIKEEAFTEWKHFGAAALHLAKGHKLEEHHVSAIKKTSFALIMVAAPLLALQWC